MFSGEKEHAELPPQEAAGNPIAEIISFEIIPASDNPETSVNIFNEIELEG
jgi:hypothetical protein